MGITSRGEVGVRVMFTCEKQDGSVIDVVYHITSAMHLFDRLMSLRCGIDGVRDIALKLKDRNCWYPLARRHYDDGSRVIFLDRHKRSDPEWLEEKCIEMYERARYLKVNERR